MSLSRRSPNHARPDQNDVIETTVYEADLFNRENPRSVINLLPEAMQARLYAHGRDRKDLFQMNERELKYTVKPTPTESRLRLAFWNEFNAVMATNSGSIVLSNVYTGICTRQYFERIMNEPTVMAWIMCPPADYISSMEEMLAESMERIREILEVSAVDPDTKEVNTKLGDLQLKVHIALENRMKGSTVQRTQFMGVLEQRNTNVNATLNANLEGGVTPAQAELAVERALKGMSLKELDEKLARIKKEQARALPAATTDEDGTNTP